MSLTMFRFTQKKWWEECGNFVSNDRTDVPNLMRGSISAYFDKSIPPVLSLEKFQRVVSVVGTKIQVGREILILTFEPLDKNNGRLRIIKP